MLISIFIILGGGQHFQQDHNIPSATSLKHLPGHKLSDLPGPPAHSAQAAAAHGMAAAAAASAKQQQQTGSGVPEGKAKEMDPPVKEADAPVFQGLLDSIGALNDSLKKPTSSTKSDDSQAVPGIFQKFKFFIEVVNFYFGKLRTIIRLLLTKTTF